MGFIGYVIILLLYFLIYLRYYIVVDSIVGRFKNSKWNGVSKWYFGLLYTFFIVLGTAIVILYTKISDYYHLQGILLRWI